MRWKLEDSDAEEALEGLAGFHLISLAYASQFPLKGKPLAEHPPHRAFPSRGRWREAPDEVVFSPPQTSAEDWKTTSSVSASPSQLPREGKPFSVSLRSPVSP